MAKNLTLCGLEGQSMKSGICSSSDGRTSSDHLSFWMVIGDD